VVGTRWVGAPDLTLEEGLVVQDSRGLG
jgi:hypothetical protein